MIFKPLNNFIIAKCIVKQKEHTLNSYGFEYKKENLPEYQIIDISKEVNDYNIGDVIIVQSSGTKLDEDIFMFYAENIVAKII